MKHTQKGFVVPIIILIALGLLGSGVYLYSRASTPLEEETKIADTSSTTNSTTDDVGASTTNDVVLPPDIVVVSPVPDVIKQPPISNDCLINQTAKFSQMEIDKGFLSVGFKEDVSFETAEKILTDLGYSYHNSGTEVTQSLYRNLHNITAIVPAGDEITASCRILENSDVVYAGPFPVLRLID